MCSACIFSIKAQRVGIGTFDPKARLAVDSSILVDQNGINNGFLNSGALVFGPEYQVGIGSRRTIGSSTRMGLDFITGATRRMVIDSIGNIGIGGTPPASVKLYVGGNTAIIGSLGIQNVNPAFSLHVSNYAKFDYPVGIGTDPTASYYLDVSGSARFLGNVRIDGTLNPNNALQIGSSTNIDGNLYVFDNILVRNSTANNYGIVRSVTSSQMKVRRAGVGFSASNFAAGASIESGFLGFGEDFTAITVIMGNARAGGTGSWEKVLIVPFEIDVINNRCRFKLTNVSSSAITFDCDWDVLLIGN
jgi:hypothetical protein